MAATMTTTLRDTLAKMRVWESLGAEFLLTRSGELDVAIHAPLAFDHGARRHLFDFIAEHARELHGLVMCGDDPQAFRRLESVIHDRASGRRYVEDPE